MSETAPEPARRNFRILSLDGGGIRGAFAAGYLAEIERVVDRPIGEYFDLIAGTSTGGIIAAGLAFRVPAGTIEEFYRDHGSRIFLRRWRRPSRWPSPIKWLDWLCRIPFRIVIWILNLPLRFLLGLDWGWIARTKYSEEELVAAMRELLGERTLERSENRLLIPSINVKKGQTKVFKTPHLEKLYLDREYRVVDVLRATSAAPTYFPHATIDPGSAYVDGGLWANNPTMVAVVESMAIARDGRQPGDDESTFDLESTHALSIGTGSSKFFAAPPGSWAGIAWWNPSRLLNLISLSQSQGAQFQANYLLGDRLERVEFDLPHGNWTLDNVKLVNEMIHIGKEKAADDIKRLRGPFFTAVAPKFRPFPSPVRSSNQAGPSDASPTCDPPT